MKIHLILSTADSYRQAVACGKPYSSYAPITLVHLAALVPEVLQAEVSMTDLNRQALPENLDADLVAISSPTCGICHAYELADLFRSQGKTVVIGGSHVTALPDEAAQHADAVVVGHAEKSWPQLLLDWQAGKLQARYSDFSFPFAVPSRPFERQLLAKMGYFFSQCYESSRGCVNQCSFCVVSSLNQNCLHYRPLEHLATDLPPNGAHILFLDSNLTAHFSQRKDFWDAMKRGRYQVYGTATVQFALDKAQVAYAASCGLKGVLVGFETLSTDSLSQANKRCNQPADYRRAVKNLHEQGIKVLGTFVFGLDGDDPRIFERTAEFIDHVGIDVVKYGIATPLPGTAFFEQIQAEGRFLTRNWSRYDTEHVVFRPLQMTPEQLYHGLGQAFRHTYGAGSIAKRLMDSSPSFITLASNLLYRKIAFSYQDYHKNMQEIL